MVLLFAGRCYEAEMCAILLPLRCAFAWNFFLSKVNILKFWPKTVDYTGVLTEIEVFVCGLFSPKRKVL